MDQEARPSLTSWKEEPQACRGICTHSLGLREVVLTRGWSPQGGCAVGSQLPGHSGSSFCQLSHSARFCIRYKLGRQIFS